MAYDGSVPPGTFDVDERHLSSEIERLGLGSHLENVFVARGNDTQPKKETSRENCMFQGMVFPPYGAQESSQQSPYNQGTARPPPNYGGVHSELMQPPYIAGMSLSSDSVEMDRDVSIPVSHAVVPSLPYQPKQEPSSLEHPCQGVQNFASGDPQFRQVIYPFDGKLVRYDGGVEGEISEESVSEHQRWQQSHQSFSQPNSVEQSQASASSMETETIGHDFEPDENGEGPLHVLSQVTDKAIMARVIDMLQKCNVVSQCINYLNKHKQTPLFLAVQAQNIPLVGWLLLNGADPNIQGTLYTDRDDYVWRAPLHLAVMMGNSGIGIVRLLLTKSSLTDINITSCGDKLTPLHVALKCHRENQNCQQIINELLDHHADICIREQSSSKTPFILAIETRDISLIQSFLEKFSADRRRSILQDQTRSGDSCLHIAAGLSRFPSSQKEILLRYLVTQGANGNIPNNVKELPRDFARTEWDRIRNF